MLGKAKVVGTIPNRGSLPKDPDFRFGLGIGLTKRVYRNKCHPLNVKYRVNVHQDEDGVFVAECRSLPGCVSQGRTRQEALANIKDAISGYLASLKKHKEPIPPPIEEETVEVSA